MLQIGFLFWKWFIEIGHTGYGYVVDCWRSQLDWFEHRSSIVGAAIFCMSRMARKSRNTLGIGDAIDLTPWKSMDIFIRCVSRYTWVTWSISRYPDPRMSLWQWMTTTCHSLQLDDDSPTSPRYITLRYFEICIFILVSYPHLLALHIQSYSTVPTQWNLCWCTAPLTSSIYLPLVPIFQAATERPAEPLSLQWLCAGRLAVAVAIALHHWHRL